MVVQQPTDDSGDMPETQHDDSPPPPPPPPPPPTDGGGSGWNTDGLTDYRRLRRSRDDRKIAGVAAGLARHLDLDPLLVRVLFFVLIFFGGSGLVLYTLLWLFVPEEGTERSVVSVTDNTRNLLVLLTLAVAVLLVIGDVGGGVGVFWPPLAVVLLGVFVWLLVRDSRERRNARPAGPGIPGGPGGSGGPGGPEGPVPPGAPLTQAWAPAPAAAPPRRRGPLLFGATLALVAVGLGVLGLLDAAGVSVVDAAYPALGLTVVGVMLVVGSVYGRPGGLILLGAVLALALAATSISEPRFEGDRDLLVRPVRAAQLAPSYDLPAGAVELDLTQVSDLEALDGRSVSVEANAGEILVVVPDGLAVDFSGDIDYGGAIDAPFATRAGWDFGLDGRLGERNEPTVTITTSLDFGHIELRQS